MQRWLDPIDRLTDADLALLPGWATAGTVEVDTTVKRGGPGERTASLRVGGSGSYAQLVLDGQATWIAGSAVRMGDLEQVNPVMSLLDGGTIQVHLQVGVDGILRAYRASGTGTLLGAAEDPLAAEAFYYIEWEVVIHDTTGLVKVWVNNQLVIDEEDIDTRAAGATADRIRWLGSEGSLWHDDRYVLDGVSDPLAGGADDGTTRYGDVYIKCDAASGEAAGGAPSAWTPDTGSEKFSRVNETTQDGSDTFLYSDTPGQRQYLTFPALAVLTNGVKGVQVHAIAREEAIVLPEDPLTLTLSLRPAATNRDGDAEALGSGFAMVTWQWGLNPDTGLPWTREQVDQTQVGFLSGGGP